ncbi:gliding motility-associated-like protein [Tenacibaculum adriaticum]|uniref:Gliding motility-associated-like protein n=1 Tax=Tenacibaculum adriaticum TaxID=413713 RepID=A0A5S5DXT3_9FLAO|nr:T9SS type B sorting domain-containing protein [Tenacibaculum adriaticum]TYP99856.1 gliding motility-associated-like protein [Tenacibaculum adriaticum]
MIKNIALILLVLSFQSINAQITLTHNIGNNPIKTDITTCEYEEYWARTFTLSDFGISTTDQFIINSGQVAISNSYDGARLLFNFYSVDSNFPNSSPERISYGNLVLAPEIGNTPKIVQIDFSTSIIIPAGVERILVEVTQMEDIYNPDYTKVIIAGTEQDNDISWFKGCRELYTYTSTENLSTPLPNANFFINVTGELINTQSSGSTTRLSHSTCDDLIKPTIYGCSGGGMSWSRDFILDDFGISSNEEFIINSGQVGIYYANWGTTIQFRVYKIDNDFPSSFSDTDLIGTSQVVSVPYIGSNSSSTPTVFNVDFDSPIVVSNEVERILIEVYQGGAVSFPAATEQDDNSVSWFRSYNGGCGPFGTFVDVVDLGHPNTKLYINVTGNVNHVTNNFEMNISNICSEFLKEFSVEDSTNIASVLWDFGDPATGAYNISTDLSPFHDFSADGIYTITATVTSNDANIEVLTETIDVKEPPNTYGINNIYACEDNFDTGLSSSFDVSMVTQQVLGGQIDKIVTYIDGSGNEYNTLPNPFTNTIRDIETISVRVSHNDNPCCYSETTFDLITNPLPSLASISDLYVCNNDTDGFAFFDLEQMKTSIINNTNNIEVEFYHENGQLIQSSLNAIMNLIINEEIITVRAINTDTNCYNETTFKLIVNPLPVANALNELIGCDDNNDGVSEYFDTSNIEVNVLGNQTNMEVSYFDAAGNQLPSPLPNPFTNSIINQETITVKVTNPLTSCYAETLLVLKTASQPEINTPLSLYGCDLGNGFASFDTSNIETELIGNQNGLKIFYFDTSGNQLPSPLPIPFQNTQAWSQIINVKVENELNNLCYSETSFELIVNELPTVNIDETYFICNLETSLNISVDNNLNTYTWEYQNGDTVSNTHEATIVNAGNYTLTVAENKNGLYCENSFEFELIRSVLPNITEIKYEELSDNNFIEIIASGDGNFEYSIDGINYQDSNYFPNIQGGNYTTYVRDKEDCGEDSKKVIVIDYPKFFTPNNDGYNDYWQIKGIEKYPNSKIFIFNRFGKLLKQLSPNSLGWNGTYNGKLMNDNDYWFKVILDDGTFFSGHFSLKK